MKMLKFIAVFLLISSGAFAQSSPGWVQGQVPSALQWNSEFASKQNTLGYTPLNPGNNLADVSNISTAQSNLGITPSGTIGNIVVSTSGSPTVATTTAMLVVKNTVPSSTVVFLPATPVANESVVVKDGSGNAQSYNITVSGSGHNIDGNSTYTIRVNKGSANFAWDGTQWEIW